MIDFYGNFIVDDALLTHLGGELWHILGKEGPVDLRCFYTKPRIVQSLKTNSLLRAKAASKVFASKLDDYWLSLRLKTLEVPAEHLLVADGSASSLPTIEESLEVYFAVKGVGRPKLFFTTAQRYIGYLTECLGNRSIDQ